MIKITDLAIPLSYDTETLKKATAEKLKIQVGRIVGVSITKRAVDARNREQIQFKMNLDVQISGSEDELTPLKYDDTVSREMKFFYSAPKWCGQKERPVVVGCGPAGMFAALVLAQAGARPVLLERGLDVDRRREKVQAFWRTGALDPDTNVQFGEGGAGTFSDGKLKIGAKDYRKMKVLSEFVKAGAPPEIMYLEKPHIGTDNLGKAVKNLREKIKEFGGDVLFGATLTQIKTTKGRVTGVSYTQNGENCELPTEDIVLAIGHSARDTFEKLLAQGVLMEQKAFAVGVRIEHPQQLIDKIRYGHFAGHPALGAADYRFAVHLKNGRSVYSFCMCPGGTVVAAASEKNGITTNGMSEFARNGKNANSALLVSLQKEDFGSDHPLAGIAFQRGIEQAAFAAGGGNYCAPVQRLCDFLDQKNSAAFGSVTPTYLPGTGFAPVDTYLPQDIADSLRQAIPEMDAWMPGYAYPDALLTGAEVRSTSPVRILRGENLEAAGIKGLYPCGEGAGYAGGIISAAVDGLRCAEKILGE